MAAARRASDQFVLDSSVALAWCFADERDTYADAVAVRLATTGAVVPAIWPLEIANALLVGERRGRSTIAQSTQWTGYLASLPIAVEPFPVSAIWTDVLSVA